MLVEELHFSALRWMGVSPMHFKQAYETPFESTPAMTFGSLVHSIVLGGDFVVWPGERRAGREWEAFRAANDGKLIVKKDEFARAEQAAIAVLSNPDAAILIAQCQKEREWTAQLFGRKCKGRIDLSGPGTAELKVSASVDPAKFIRHATKMGWHAQIAWYQAARRALGEDPGPGHIIAVEPKPPHAVTVFRLKERALEDGLRLCRVWAETLKNCEESGHWPGYVSSIVDFDIAEEVAMDFGDEEAA